MQMQTDGQRYIPKPVGLSRTNAHVYQQVPIVLDSPPLPASQNATSYDPPAVSDFDLSSSSESPEEDFPWDEFVADSPADEHPEVVCGLPCPSLRKKNAVLLALDMLEGRRLPEAQPSRSPRRRPLRRRVVRIVA